MRRILRVDERETGREKSLPPFIGRKPPSLRISSTTS